MKLSVVVLDLNNKVDDVKLAQRMENSNCEILIARTVTKNLKLENVKEFIFNTKNKDEILNTLIPISCGEQLIVVRDFCEENYDELNNLAKSLKNNNDIIVMQKKKTNRFVKFFKSIWQAIVKFMCGYKLYDSDHSIIAFSSVPNEVLKTTDNCSFYTKVNLWVGMNITYMIGHTKKQRYDFLNLSKILSISISAILIAGMIVLLCLVPYVSSRVWLRMLCILTICISFVIILIEMFLMIINLVNGKSVYTKAEIINKEILLEEGEKNEKN